MSLIDEVQNEYYTTELEIALENQDKNSVRKLLLKINVADLSLLLSDYDNEKRKLFIDLSGFDFPPEVFLKFNDHVIEEFLLLLGDKKAARILSKLEVADIIAILEDFKVEIREPIINLLAEKLKTELKAGFAYPLNSAARLMHKNFISVPSHWNLKQVNEFCAKNKEFLTDSFYGVFVIDAHFKPIGLVSTKELVVNHSNTKIGSLMDEDFRSFNYLEDKDKLAVDFQKYDLILAPILNNDGRIIGSVNIDDMVEVIEESVEEDILYLGGVYESDIFAKVYRTIKKRFPWLFVNLITAILASVVIGVFDETIKNVVALAVLMPIIASMGGNAGTQTVTIAVRALATKELSPQNVFKVISKEILVGMINGLFFAIICFAMIMLVYDNFKLAILFSSATIITLSIAGFAGAVIPIVIDKLKGDPAISSSVILTTITDVIAFLAFLGLATLFI
jgi:magnesium transporter